MLATRTGRSCRTMGSSMTCCRDDSAAIKDELHFIKDAKKRWLVGQLSIPQVEAMQKRYEECLEAQEKAKDAFDECPLEENKEKLDKANQDVAKQRKEIKTYYDSVKEQVGDATADDDDDD